MLVAHHNFVPNMFQWYYNEHHHGQGPMNGVGGNIKNIFQHVKSKKCVINGAKDFAQSANKIINGIYCLYLEPQDIKRHQKFQEH